MSLTLSRHMGNLPQRHHRVDSPTKRTASKLSMSSKQWSQAAGRTISYLKCIENSNRKPPHSFEFTQIRVH